MSFTSAEAAPRWRDVYLASAARGVSYCGDFLAATALALTLQTQGDNGRGVAALLLASTLPLALFGPLAGRLADRVDSRLLLVTTGAVQALVCAVLADTSSPVLMIALVAVLSTGLAITQPTLSALVPAMVGKQNLGRASAISQTAGSIGMLGGPALGGLLVGAYGVHVPLLVDAGTYLAIAVAGLLLRTRRGGSPSPTAPAAAVGAAAPWRLRDDRLLVTLLAAFGAVIASMTAVNVVEIFFVRETLGASTTMYGLVATVWTVGLLAGAWPMSRFGGDDRRLVTFQVLLLAVIAVVVLASAGVGSAVWILPLYLIGGGANAGLNVLCGVVLGRRVPAAVRGRAAGAFSSVANTANVFGYLLAGLLLPFFSPRSLIAGTGALSLIIALGFLGSLLAKGVRRPAAIVGYGDLP